MSLRTRGAGACALAVVALATACGPPTIESGDLGEADAQACRDLVDDLPDTLLGEDAVEVDGDSAYGAAWGDPAIVLTCGVGAIDISEAPPCLDVDGVGWVVQEGSDGTTFTADGYRPRVQVVVPDDYAPEAGALTALGPTVEAHTEVEDECL